MAWTAFNLLSDRIGQRLSGLWGMNKTTGKSTLYEALVELQGAAKALRLTGDLQATNAAVSGGADETYTLALGNAGVLCTVIKSYVRAKYEAATGAAFPVCSVQFGYSVDSGATLVPVTADTQLSGDSLYLEIDPTVLTSIPATAVFYAQVTVPAAVSVALGLDLGVQR